MNLIVKLVIVLCTGLAVAGCSVERKKESARSAALNYFRSGELEKCRIELQNVLRLDPNDPIAIEHMGLLWFERGAMMRALSYFLKARPLRPESPDIQVKIIKIMQQAGKPAEARKEALALLKRAPSHPEGLYLLAELSRSREDYAAAEEAVRKAGNDTVAFFHLAKASLALKVGDVAAARTASRRAMVANPQLAEARLAMAKLYLREGKRNEADKEFRAAAEIAPLRSPVKIQFAGFRDHQGATAEAEAYLKELLRKSPDFLPAFRELARISLRKKDYKGALEHLLRTFERDTLHYEGMLLRAQINLAQGELQKAESELVEISKVYPGLPTDKTLLARIHVQRHDLGKAVSALEQAVAADPENEATILMLAELQLQIGNPKPVVTNMLDLVSRRPDLDRAQVLLIDAMGALGKIDEVLQTITEAQAKSPNDPRGLYFLGLVHMRRSEWDQARSSFEKCVAAVPDFFPATASLTQLEVTQGKFAEARSRAEALIGKYPKSASAWMIKSRVLLAEKNYEKAAQSLQEVLNADAEILPAYSMLADAFLAQSSSTEIVSQVEEFLKSRPDDLNALQMVGRVFLKMGQFQKSRDAYELLLKSQPENETVLNNLAYLYAEELGDLERATTLAQKARSLAPDSPTVADTLGWILVKRNDLPNAIALIRESAQKLPNNAEIQYHLGVAYQMAGEFELARKALNEAAKSKVDFPGKSEIAKRLADLAAAKK
jgi:predicted Zn-dependent protease